MARFPASERTFAYTGTDTIWFNGNGLRYYALRYGAELTTTARAHFLIYRGARHGAPPGYTTLRRWRLPDGGTLALFGRH
jgi:hypothetical protein